MRIDIISKNNCYRFHHIRNFIHQKAKVLLKKKVQAKMYQHNIKNIQLSYRWLSVSSPCTMMQFFAQLNPIEIFIKIIIIRTIISPLLLIQFQYQQSFPICFT